MKAKTMVLVMALALPLASQAGFREFTLHFKVAPRGKASYTVPREMVFYMDGNWLRQEILTGEGRAVFIMALEGDRLVSTILDLDKKTYMRTVSQADDDDRFLFELPRGEESPCRKDPGATCKRLGRDRIQGYRVIKWQVTDSDGTAGVYWYAPKLGFFLRSEDDEMVLTATRIVDRAPPASLFKPPAGFREIGYLDYLKSQGTAVSGPEEDGPAYGEPAAVSEPENGAETAGTADEAAEAPVGEAVVEGVRNALKGLFGN